MAASTYNDTTTATIGAGPDSSSWTLIDLNPGYDFRENPDDANKTDRRKHNVLSRFRNLKGVTSYGSQEGQVGVGVTEVAGVVSTGLRIGSMNTLGYICSEDRMELVETGSNIMRQYQVWEHIGEWEEYDVTVLA